MSEYEKMINEMAYNSFDAELVNMRTRAHELCRQYNLLSEHDEKRTDILLQLLPNAKSPVLQGGIFIDYGRNMHIGAGFCANHGFTANDNGGIWIGKDVTFGANVSLYTAVHPMDFESRVPYRNDEGLLHHREYAKPIHIGDGCWLGGSVTVLPGVTIGKRCVIGAGSVVTGDIPDDSVAAGNPCQIVQHHAKEQEERTLFVRTFGNFEVFYESKPLKFRYLKTKELLAYLIDRKGALCPNREIISVLWEDNPSGSDKYSYLKNLRTDLIHTLSLIGYENSIVRTRGTLGIVRDDFDCDYYSWLKDKKKFSGQYQGEYMKQYSWAEDTHGYIEYCVRKGI